MKPGPIAAMAIIMGLSIWVMFATSRSVRPAEGAAVFEIVLQNDKLKVEQAVTPEGFRYRFLNGPDAGATSMSPDEFQQELAKANRSGRPPLLRLFNVSSYVSLPWIALGLGAQLVFSARFIVQWLASERARRSVVPPLFWYLSLLGGLCLTGYFVWRHDMIGVLGQTSGLVIYIRNIRLLRLTPPPTGAPKP